MSSVGHFSVQFAGLEECPEPFRDRLRHFLSPSEAIFEIIYSPAFVAGRLCFPASVFCVTNRQWIMLHESKSGDVSLDERELAPAAALFLTDRHLMIIAEEKSRAWFVKRDRTKYGAITTYCPRSRISGFQVQEHRRFHILELEAHGAHGTEEFQVPFPSERNEEVTKLLSQAFPARAG